MLLNKLTNSQNIKLMRLEKSQINKFRIAKLKYSNRNYLIESHLIESHFVLIGKLYINLTVCFYNWWFTILIL